MSTLNGYTKRVTCKRPHPNLHVRELLESLHRDAVKAGSSIVPALKEAISSLEKYPLPLSSGAECAILKGFDQRLCEYIDLHLNEQLSRFKKTKVSEYGNSSDKIPRPVPPIEKNADTEMASTSKKNLNKKKRLVINIEKCSFKSKFGESNNTVDPNMPSSAKTNDTQTMNNIKPTIESVGNGEKNNNTAKSDCSDEVCSGTDALNTYFVNRSRRDAVNSGFHNDKIQSDCHNDANFTLCENWESLTNDDCNQLKNKYDSEIKKCYPPIQVIDPSEEENTSSDNSVSEINVSSDDESISQPISNQQPACNHTKGVLYCKLCESITTAADAFQLYFKEKTKRDAEEIGKCVLPRKMYKPAYRSGAYAILVALLEQRSECPYRDCLTKEELIQKAQKHTDQSFTHPKPESNYTAWTNAKRLINKGMIQITNCEHRGDVYMLTAMGRAVAMEIVKEHTPTVTVNDVIFHGQRNDRVPSHADVVLVPPPPIAALDEEQSSVFIEMPPGTFEIVMLIDKRENLDKILPTSPNTYCKYEARSLTVGDFLWVARSKKTGQELVLPYILERKRIDDLSSSIKDGRFHEQKFRLRKCGLKNVVYLVESCNRPKQHVLPVGTLVQAVVNTTILEEFNVVKTTSLEHTFKFLGMLSESLVHEFLPVFLRGCNMDTQGRELMTFEFFNKFSCKNKPLTVRDTFIKMLLQLKGLSVEKALAITNKYNTPRALMKAYDKCTVKEGELLLAGLKFNNFTNNVGPAVSKTVYKLFSKVEF